MNAAEPPPVQTRSPGAAGGGYPLALWFASTVSLLLAVVIGVLGWVSWHNSQRAVVDLATQLQSRTGEQVEEHLRSYLDAPTRAIDLMAAALHAGVVTPDKPESARRLLLRLVRLYPEIAYFNIGASDRSFIGAGRADTASREVVIEEAHAPDPEVLHQYAVGPGGTRGEHLRDLDFGDFGEQAWYAEVPASGRAGWSSVYHWTENPSVVVIGFGRSVETGMPGTRAVVGVDLFLHDIGDYLAGLESSPGSRVFIVEQNGLLIGSSHGGTLRQLPGAGVERLPATQSPDALIRGAALELAGVEGGLRGIDDTLQLPFDAALGRIWLRASRWRDAHGLDWLIVVVAPQKDFTGVIDAGMRDLMLIGVLLLVLSLCAAWLMTRYLARPVQRLELAARALATGDFDAPLPRSWSRELESLAHAFDEMRRRLRAAFREVESVQQELERRVEQRTVELRVANDELERLSLQDGLTGLANRRRFDATLGEEWQRARRSGKPFTLVMCDIDFFKAYNDRYGHARGDEILVRVARVLQAELRRATDLAARYGGEEYALILPDTGAEDARGVVEQIRRGLGALALAHEGSPFGCVTASFGIACHLPHDGMSGVEELLIAADQALYRAKAAGRNALMMHSRPGENTP